MNRANYYCPVNKLALLLSIIFGVVFLAPGLAGANNPVTGLILPTEDELRGVPFAHTPFSGTVLAKKVDLSQDFPPPGNQGRTNSCVAWSLAYALKGYQERKEEGHALVRKPGKPDYNKIFSPAFIYNQLNNGRDGGIHIHTALNFLQEKGVCTWKDMPFRVADHLCQPSPQARIKARRYRINTWRQVNTQSTKELKTHIQAGYPIVMVTALDQGFEKFDNPPGWIWKRQIGSFSPPHAMTVIGYDDFRRAFRVINSWGQERGDGRYVWIDYQHFQRVVKVGYVAMDTRNGSPPVIKPQPVKRTTGPTVMKIPFKPAVSRVSHNLSYPNRPELVSFIGTDGQLQIPAQAGRTNQVVIHFFHRQPNGQPGQPVLSLIAQYSEYRGQAACGTAVYPIPATGLSTTFSAWIPYNALKLPTGRCYQAQQGKQYRPARSHLLAVPRLFVDNFGVTTTHAIHFPIDR